MNLEEDKKNLKEQILALSSIYTKKRLSTKFVEGETFIPASGATLKEHEVNNVIDAALNGWATEGEYSKLFSRGLREYLNRRFCILCNSGSSANLLAITATTQKEFKDRAAKEGDEFITVAVGFPTTISGMVQNKIVPVFVDINPQSLTPDVDMIEQAVVEGKTKGIVIAHALGSPYNVDAIRDICDEYGLWFLEDTCDALGSRYNGQMVGTQGTMSTMSFFPAHHITSLDYEEPIIVRKRGAGEISIFEIGDFVENIYPASPDKWSCIAFDRDGDLQFRSITSTVKHPVNEPLYKVTLQTGRHSTVSASHSLFTAKNNEIVAIETSDLRVGDFVFVPKNYRHVNLEYGSKEIEITRYAKGSWKPYLEKHSLTEDFARFLGLFVAEGSFNHTASGNYTVALTFSADEDELEYARFIKSFLEVEFNISSKTYKKDGANAINLIFSDKGLYEFLELHCGRGAGSKKVPGFLFTAPRDIMWAFINGYYDGDGTHENTYGKHGGYSRKCKTISKELAIGLFYLLELYGIHPRWKEEKPSTRDFGNYVSDTKRTYSVDFSTKSLVDANGFRGEHSKGRNFGDLALLKITKIEEVLPTTGYVYDLSVDGYENFVGGIGLCLHNTGQGGAVFTNSGHVKKVLDSLRAWGRGCWCLPGKDNTCGKRFDWCIGDEIEYDHKYVFDRIGYNLQITDFQSAIGLAQLDKIKGFEDTRKHNWKRLKEALSEYKKFFIMPQAIPHADPSWFGFHMTVKGTAPFTRREITEYLESKKIGTRLLFGGNLLQQPAFQHIPHKVFGTLEDSDLITRGTFWLGVHQGIDEPRLEYIISTFHEFMRQYARL